MTFRRDASRARRRLAAARNAARPPARTVAGYVPVVAAGCRDLDIRQPTSHTYQVVKVNQLVRTDRREQLVDAALEIIEGRGVASLRTRDVAALVGVTHALVHYYFPTKADLVQAVLARMKAEIDSFQESIASEAGNAGLRPAEVLRRHLGNLADFVREAPRTALIMMELTLRAEHEPELFAVVEEIYRPWRRFLVGVLQAGVDRGDFGAVVDAEATADLIVAAFEGAASQARSRPSTGDGLARQLERLVIASDVVDSTIGVSR